MVEDSTLISVFSPVNSKEALPVAVNVALFGLGAPYSVGFRNCFSAAMLCDETVTMALLTFCESINTLPKIMASADVEQAPYKPKKHLEKL